MNKLHPAIRQLALTAPAGAVRAALGSDEGISNILDNYAGLRLSVPVDESADSIIPGTWSEGAAKQLDYLSTSEAAAFLFIDQEAKGRELAFANYCREQRLNFDIAMILRSDSCHFHGNAFIIGDMPLQEADKLSYRFSLPAFLSIVRGEPVRVVVTG
jgi:hypothetical protein